MHSEVTAIVPSYRPESSSLLALVRDLVEQGLPVVVADDASPCTVDPVLRDAGALGARVVRHRRNAGIARSLNDGLAAAAAQGARWLLTVDQDSMLPTSYVPALLAAATEAEEALGQGSVGAIAAAVVSDASGDLGYPIRALAGVPVTEEVIQTGTMWAVDPLLALGGFDESLGIDAVDAAACLALRRAGLHVVVASGVSVEHRIGDGHQVRLLGRSVLSSGHSAERRTTIVRNRLRLFPAEFAESPRHALRTLRRVIMGTALAVTVEDDRWAKAKASARGLLPRRNG